MEELIPNLTAAMYQTLRRQCTKPYGGNVPNLTAAMYQTIRRKFTKPHGGNVPNCTAAIGVGGHGGTLTKYPGKSRKPKTPQLATNTTNNIKLDLREVGGGGDWMALA